MKHGRRHDSLKERVYRERAAQDAPGYRRAYEPIDVRPPSGEHEALPAEPVALGDLLPRKARKALARVGVDERER